MMNKKLKLTNMCIFEKIVSMIGVFRGDFNVS